MEQGPASLKPDYYTKTSREFDDLEQPFEITPELKDEFIKINALDIAVKFYDSVDGLAPIEVEHYQSLYENGWAAQPASEVIRIFGDWPTFQDAVAKQRSEQLWDRWREKQEILAKADQALEAGVVPDKLFNKVEPFVSPGQPRQRTRKDGSTYIVNDSGAITDTVVTPEEKITRYCRYRLAEDILAGAGKHPSEARLLSIVLGVSVKDLSHESGTLLSSFNSEIDKSSNGLISPGAVEVKADSLGMFDYVYPDIRKKMLADIARDSGYKDTPAQPLATEFYYNTLSKQLMIGKGALEACLESGGSMSDIYLASEVLLDKSIPLEEADRTTNKYRGWGRAGMIAYGQWILNLAGEANDKIFNRAGRMGIGPSMSSIVQKTRPDRFSSRTEFYDGIGVTKKNPPGMFDLSFDDCIAYVQSIAPKYDNKISETTLKQEYAAAKKEGRHVPSYRMLVTVARLNDILEAAGLPTRQGNYGIDGVIERGLRFYDEHGARVPTKRDFALTEYLPKPNTLLRYCGGIKGFQRKILEAVAERAVQLDDSEIEELAA